MWGFFAPVSLALSSVRALFLLRGRVTGSRVSLDPHESYPWVRLGLARRLTPMLLPLRALKIFFVSCVRLRALACARVRMGVNRCAWSLARLSRRVVHLSKLELTFFCKFSRNQKFF